jgi:hypothetical protein
VYEQAEPINSTAYFDALYISMRLQTLLGSVFTGELHLIAYLSCLLGLYESHPISDWGYGFTGTTEGAPYSPAITAASDHMERSGTILRRNQIAFVSDRGVAECELLSSMHSNTTRQRYLEGACSSLLTLPIGIVREALSREPELRSMSIHRTARQLLQGPGLESLYRQFELLRSVLDHSSDILAPAMVWLTYLSCEPARNEVHR